MSGEDFVGVTLANVDPSIVSCWDKMVKQGEECSLLLKHSKGKVVATLQCTTPVRTSTSLPSPCPSAVEPFSDEVRDDIISTVGCANNDLQGQEMKGQNNEGVSSFISALKNTFNLWPEDDPPHRCHPWEPCRNLKCRVKAEIENQEYAAAGECDDCGENVNDCECGS